MIFKEPELNPDQALTTEQLFSLLEQKIPITLIDVRTEEEHQEYNIGGKLLPLAELPFRLDELNREDDIVLYCRSGKRSLKALEILQDAGFLSVKHLAEGI